MGGGFRESIQLVVESEVDYCGPPLGHEHIGVTCPSDILLLRKHVLRKLGTSSPQLTSQLFPTS